MSQHDDQHRDQHARPAVAPDQAVPLDQAADMGEPPDDLVAGGPGTADPSGPGAEEEYAPVDPDEEAVVDEEHGGPVPVEDPFEAYPPSDAGEADAPDRGDLA